SGYSREVALEGRAFFAVAESREPFRIYTPGGEVEVLGTRFELESREREVQVTVVEGTVRIHAEGGDAEVGPKQVARAAEMTAPEVLDVDDVFEHMGWLGDFLAFESTPLVDVVEEFERRFDLQVEIADPQLLSIRVTGWFVNAPPEEMIAGICAA